MEHRDFGVTLSSASLQHEPVIVISTEQRSLCQRVTEQKSNPQCQLLGVMPQRYIPSTPARLVSLFWKVESSDKCQYTYVATWKRAVAVWITNRSGRSQDVGARWHLGAGHVGRLLREVLLADTSGLAPLGATSLPLGVPSRVHYPICFQIRYPLSTQHPLPSLMDLLGCVWWGLG